MCCHFYKTKLMGHKICFVSARMKQEITLRFLTIQSSAKAPRKRCCRFLLSDIFLDLYMKNDRNNCQPSQKYIRRNTNSKHSNIDLKKNRSKK